MWLMKGLNLPWMPMGDPTRTMTIGQGLQGKKNEKTKQNRGQLS